MKNHSLYTWNRDKKHRKVLLVISSHWPEPAASAAGYRMLQTLVIFSELGYDVHYACTVDLERVEDKEAFLKTDYAYAQIAVNDDGFDAFIQELEPQAVLYDRFNMEEQFGWRIRNQNPALLEILDTEDLHFLRQARREAIKKQGLEGLKHLDTYLYSDYTKRELASLYRVDLSIMISRFEIELLCQIFDFPEDKLSYLPFIHEGEISRELPFFEEREGFMHIGNFYHAPNVDAVRELKRMWPSIRKATGAQIHIYGAYMPDHIRQMHNPSQGFIIEGRAERVDEVMQKHRVLLAPLRFGAGQKGKLFDAMINGLPSVTTDIGAEAMIQDGQVWPGHIAELSKTLDFEKKASDLYKDEQAWNHASNRSKEILDLNFNASHAVKLVRTLRNLAQNHLKLRKKHFIGEVFKSDQMARLKYMSLYISEKNKNQ